ncbi:ferredoxin [bacterium]|nr:ferredoxin [bacterium]
MYIAISDKCTACGVCSAINPEVFDVVKGCASVNQECIEGFEDDCIDAALACPVNAIKIHEF